MYTKLRGIASQCPHYVAADFCANACFHKLAFCGTRFQDTKKPICNSGTRSNDE